MSANKTRKFIWIPRILGIAFALFLMLFSFDVFENGVSMEALGGFLVHSLPSFLLLIFIALSWKTPAVTGVLFVLTALFFLAFFRTYDEWTSFLIISVLPAVIGILFFVAGTLKAPAKTLDVVTIPEDPEDPEDTDDIDIADAETQLETAGEDFANPTDDTPQE